jgi:hypothetical protein
MFDLERSTQLGFGVWTSAITDGNGVRLLFRRLRAKSLEDYAA